MKRNTIITILLIAAVTMSAQEKMVSVFPAERQHPAGIAEGKAVRMPSESMLVVAEDPNFVAEVTEGENEHPLRFEPGQRPARKRAAAAQSAGYLPPEGTLFLGYMPDGKDTYIKNPGVIGAWSHDLKCWKWRNTATGSYSSIDYINGFISRYPTMVEDGDSYYMDEQYNFYDSIVGGQGGYGYYKSVKGDEGYIWQMGTPVQVVHRGEEDEKFVILTKYSDPSKIKDTDAKLAAGGLPSSTTDGLWPLTNAVSTSKDGQKNLLSYKENNKNFYYFGTYVDSVANPVEIVTHYDKPQRMLYVKSISVYLGSNGTMKFDSLHVDVLDAQGGIIAQSDAAIADAVNINTTPKGKILTFYFATKTDYNEVLSEGFTTDEEFDVVISGIKPTDNFGIYCAPSTIYESKSYITMSDETIYSIEYDPYIMLNGIFPTFEDYVLAENPDAETGQIGDTIPVKFNLTEGLTYKYGATYAANETYNGITEFAFYSTMQPYNEGTRYWNLQIERPGYITMSADYETNLGGNDNEPITYWDYYRLFVLYIYADSKPVIGDCIKLTQYGKSIVFRIDAVMDEGENNTLARKLLNNGQLMIIRDGKTYNAQGLLVE